MNRDEKFKLAAPREQHQLKTTLIKRCFYVVDAPGLEPGTFRM